MACSAWMSRMTEYLKPGPFSSRPASKNYRDRYEDTFGRRPEKPEPVFTPPPEPTTEESP